MNQFQKYEKQAVANYVSHVHISNVKIGKRWNERHF